MPRSRIGRIYTAQTISNGYRLLIARFQLSNSMLESGQTTQCDYRENSGFGRPTEREWGSPAPTVPPEKENQPMRIYIIGHDGILGEGALVQMQVRQPGFRRHRCAVDHRRQAPLHPLVSSSPPCASLAVPTPVKPRVVLIPAWAIRPPRSTASGPPLHRRSLRSAEYQYRRCSRIFRDGGAKITGGAAKIDVGRDLPNRARRGSRRCRR
jgi:hypothetical protein